MARFAKPASSRRKQRLQDLKWFAPQRGKVLSVSQTLLLLNLQRVESVLVHGRLEDAH